MNTNTNIDSKLSGNWRLSVNSYYGTSNDYYWYTFNKDGTFNYTSTISYGEGISPSYVNKVGNYIVANGKITFSNVVRYDKNGKKIENCPNVVREYQILSPL